MTIKQMKERIMADPGREIVSIGECELLCYQPGIGLRRVVWTKKKEAK